MRKERCEGRKGYNCFLRQCFHVVCSVPITFRHLDETFIPCLVSAAVSWSTSSCRSPNIFEACKLNNFHLLPFNRQWSSDSVLSSVLWILPSPVTGVSLAVLLHVWDEQKKGGVLLDMGFQVGSDKSTWKKPEPYCPIAKEVEGVLFALNSVVVGAGMFSLFYRCCVAHRPYEQPFLDAFIASGVVLISYCDLLQFGMHVCSWRGIKKLFTCLWTWEASCNVYSTFVFGRSFCSQRKA